MRLGIDAKALVGNRTGIGNWIWFLLQELPNHIPDLEIFAYAPSSHIPILPKSIEKYAIRDNSAYPLMSGFFWLKLRAGHLVQDDSLDVFWAARTLYPIGLEKHTPVVSTIYDLVSVLYPSTMSIANLLAYKLWFKSDLQKATRIVAISQGTSDRLNAWIGRGADAIVCPGVAEQYTPKSRTTIDHVMLKYGLTWPYLIFVGTLEPRKNMASILDALEVVNSSRSTPLSLALVGKRGWKNKALFERLDRGMPNVIELGFVPDQDLPSLYSGATALLMPSLYEGYGMPAAEAAACGIHVVASDIPELREAAGGSGIYIQPSPEGIVTGILMALAAESQLTPPPPISWRDSSALLAKQLQEAAASR
ncbi:MAG: glycosyltransferase family 1 protein [Azonexus sp.]|nr:glycosyltransferase family 1 protein [Azonexus sp.]